MKLPIDLNEPIKPPPEWGEILAYGLLVVALFGLMFVLLGWWYESSDCL